MFLSVCLSVCLSAVKTYSAQTEEVQPGPQRGTPKTGADRPQPTDDHGNEKLSLGPPWNGTARIWRNRKKMDRQTTTHNNAKKGTDRPQLTKNAKKSDRQTTTHKHTTGRACEGSPPDRGDPESHPKIEKNPQKDLRTVESQADKKNSGGSGGIPPG